MEGEEPPGAEKGGGAATDEDGETRRRRLPVPRGRLQIGSLVGTLVSITALLSWLGIHPGGSDTPSPQPTPVSVATSGSAVTFPPISLPPFSFPPPAHPTLRLSPTSGPAGTRVTVTCDGFPPRVEVDIDLNATNLATVTTDAAGHFSTIVRIPPDWSFPGRWAIGAQERDSTNHAEEYFEVS